MPKDELNAYGVGLMRLSEMSITPTNFSDDDIEYIGYCSIRRHEITIGKVGNFWGIRGRMSEQVGKVRSFERSTHFRAYWIVKGKRTMALRPHSNKTIEQMVSEFNSRDYSKPLNEMNAKEIFNAAKGKKPCRRHAPKTPLRERLAYAARMEK